MEIARLETTAADHRADFVRECERADRLTVELLQATAEMMAIKEMTARMEGELAALPTGGRVAGSTDKWKSRAPTGTSNCDHSVSRSQGACR